MRTWLILTALVAVPAALVAFIVATSDEPPRSGPEYTPGPAMALVAYSSCSDMLAGLREHTARSVGPYGFPSAVMAADGAVRAAAGAGEGSAAAVPSAAQAAPAHSTTNVHEAGVDEPDLVKSDGRRLITVEQGMLRVVDAATRKVSATLRVASPDDAGGAADLLVAGDRALVILRGGMMMPGGGMMPQTTGPVPAPLGGTRYVLVDLSGQPRVMGTLTPQGTYVDARMVGSTVRLVVRSQPELRLPAPSGRYPEKQLIARNQAAVRTAPIAAWLPRYQVTDGLGAAATRTVPCTRVSHPADYTGTSLLTIYSIDLSRGLQGIPPVSIAADGDTVYGTPSSLYVASNPRWWAVPAMAGPDMPVDRAPISSGSPGTPQPAPPVRPTSPRTAPPMPPTTPRTAPPVPPEQTQIHRFDISGAGAPRYVASGQVAGRLLNQYSLSDYAGHLRVATTKNDSTTSSSSVYELDADTMAKVGQLDGLGTGERIYSVRFIGPVGYVVTFRQVDPLYTLDLRNPAAPRVAGQLKINGYSSFLQPAAEGRLIGIGQDADSQGRISGLQISLFDVSDPAVPHRLAHLVEEGNSSVAESDPHAFLYWPESGLAVLPSNSWRGPMARPGALVLRITGSQIATTGTISQPTGGPNAYGMGIQRALVIGGSLWTVSDTGLMVNDATTLATQAWIPYA